MRRTILGALVLGLAVASAGPVWAQQCPDQVPSGSQARRAQAKQWFSAAETAENQNDLVSAVKAYQCSLKMVPHAFTAFNLGRLAERTGDLELALEAFGTYLQLSPEAQDKAEIEGKITALTARISALRSDRDEPPPLQVPDPPPRAEPVSPTPSGDLAVRQSQRPPPRRADEEESRLSPLVWVVGGVGLAAAAGGIVLNISARSKMKDCKSLWDVQREQAMAACDAAPPRAYASYALIGVGVAAAVADAVLIFMRDESESQVSLAPLRDGAVVLRRFRF
jgi:tetratricopeptide (TPR) repeat protein